MPMDERVDKAVERIFRKGRKYKTLQYAKLKSKAED
jgi:hypothetical protein